MKLALCYFTFSKDAPLLTQSLRSVARLRNLRPDVESDVYIFDDGASPMDAPPDGVVYTQTHWNRRGNLNGVENLYAMLATYQAVAAKADYDFILKVDCDTYINDWAWLDDVDLEQTVNVGMFNTQYFAHGCLYAFTQAGLAAIAALAQRDAIHRRIASGYACEDLVFGVLASMTGMQTKRLNNHYNVLGRGRGGYQDFEWTGHEAVPRLENPDPEQMATHMSVTFKRNSHYRSPAERALDRADALTRMTAYADWVDTHQQTANRKPQTANSKPLTANSKPL